MINRQSDINIIKKILARYFNDGAHKVFIFGSRADGTANTYSDYDIGLVGPRLPADKYFDIVAEFEESDLPVKVDLVQMCDVSSEFRSIAARSTIPLIG
ncbi:MAG: nucleotidyltransferase family protein [bacterium]